MLSRLDVILVVEGTWGLGAIFINDGGKIIDSMTSKSYWSWSNGVAYDDG